MFRIVQATHNDQTEVRNLFHEYLTWVNAINIQEKSFTFDVDSVVDKNIQKMHVFMPPEGRLLLAYSDDAIAGCAPPALPSPS